MGNQMKIESEFKQKRREMELIGNEVFFNMLEATENSWGETADGKKPSQMSKRTSQFKPSMMAGLNSMNLS